MHWNSSRNIQSESWDIDKDKAHNKGLIATAATAAAAAAAAATAAAANPAYCCL